MLNLLPFDIQREILLYIDYRLFRSLNNHYKQLTDQFELQVQTSIPFIITKSLVLDYINTEPQLMTYCIICKNQDQKILDIGYHKKRKDYILCNYKKCIENECKCRIRCYERFPISLNKLLNILMNDFDYNYYTTRKCKDWFIPGYEFIEYSIMKHPLVQMNITDDNILFIIQGFKKMITYYIKLIQLSTRPFNKNNAILMYIKILKQSLIRHSKNNSDEYRIINTSILDYVNKMKY